MHQVRGLGAVDANARFSRAVCPYPWTVRSRARTSRRTIATAFWSGVAGSKVLPTTSTGCAVRRSQGPVLRSAAVAGQIAHVSSPHTRADPGVRTARDRCASPSQARELSGLGLSEHWTGHPLLRPGVRCCGPGQVSGMVRRRSACRRRGTTGEPQLLEQTGGESPTREVRQPLVHYEEIVAHAAHEGGMSDAALLDGDRPLPQPREQRG